MRCYLVVAWDGNVHVFQWRVSIAEGNNWDVYVGSLSNRLVVSSGVSHNQQARFSEGSLKYLIFNLKLFLYNTIHFLKAASYFS